MSENTAVSMPLAPLAAAPLAPRAAAPVVPGAGVAQKAPVLGSDSNPAFTILISLS